MKRKKKISYLNSLYTKVYYYLENIGKTKNTRVVNIMNLIYNIRLIFVFYIFFLVFLLYTMVYLLHTIYLKSVPILLIDRKTTRYFDCIFSMLSTSTNGQIF